MLRSLALTLVATGLVLTPTSPAQAAQAAAPVAPADLPSAGVLPAFVISDTRIDDSRGLARSTRRSDRLFTHNGSGGGNRVFAIDDHGDTRAVLRLRKVRNKAWQDITSGPRHRIWVGDLGNQKLRRKRVAVHSFREPKRLDPHMRRAAKSFALAYPDGRHHAQALMVHPKKGRLFVITHAASGGGIYKAPRKLSARRVNVLTRVADAPARVTSADFSPDGRGFVLASAAGLHSYASLRARPVVESDIVATATDAVVVARSADTLLTAASSRRTMVFARPFRGGKTPDEAVSPAPEPATPDPAPGDTPSELTPEPAPTPPQPTPSAAPAPTSTPAPAPAPAPSAPTPSTPAPSAPTPSAPAPSAPAPSAPTPSTPAPSTPAPSTPAPSAPAPSAPTPSTPAPSTPVPGSTAPTPDRHVVAADSFDRGTTSGWGSADTGGTWTPTGPVDRWRTASGKGVYTMPAPGAGASNRLAVSVADLDGVIDFSPSAVADGGGLYVTAAARISGSSEYQFRTRLMSDGTVRLWIARVVAGTETTLGAVAVPQLRYRVGDTLRLRFAAHGSTLTAALWHAGEIEPAPQVVRSDNGAAALRAAGGVAVSAFLSGSATTTPVAVRFDDLAVTVPGTSASAPAPVEVPTPESVTPVPPVAPATTTLLEAGFDALVRGPMAYTAFRSQLGGTSSQQYNYDDSSVVADTRGSGNAYRVTLEEGTIRGNPSGNHGIVVFSALARPVENACLSYDIRFDSDFDWSLGGKLPGLQGTAPGVSPSLPTGGGNPGDKGWSGRVMWLTPKSYSWAGPRNMGVQYMYGPAQVSTYGDNLRWNASFTAGTWHTVRMCYEMNTVGKADGRLQAWLDGTQVLDIDDYVFRLRADVAISHLNWSVFRGGGTLDWAGSRKNHIDFDNVVVTTKDAS